MENQQTPISSNATLSALAGILFFSPLVKKSITVPSTQANFILGYCKVGNLNLALFTITLIIFIINLRLPNVIFDRIITLCTGAICIISIFSIFACLNGVLIFDSPVQSNGTRGEGSKATGGLLTPVPHKETILKSFLPVYNISLRYQTANFQTPYRRAKESVLWRTIFSFLTLLFGAKVWMIIIVCILIRLLLLLMNIDIIPNNLKKFLNHGFLMQPEEITVYLTGGIKDKLKKSPWIVPPARGEGAPTSLGAEGGLSTVAIAKQAYSEMQESRLNTTLQYLSFAAILRVIRRNTTLSYELIIPLFALLYLIAKILLTYRKYHKLPNIPILYELRSLLLT